MSSTRPLDPAQLARATKKVVDRLAPFCSLRLDASTSTPKSNLPSAAASPFASPAVSRTPSQSNILQDFTSGSSIGHGEQIPMSSPPIQDASRIVLKVQSKVSALISAIDAHVQACQIALEISTVPQANSSANSRLAQARTGLELSQRTAAAFMKVSQDLYKIASYTKDRSESVLVPPGAGQEPSLRLTLNKVGQDLVSNLGLFLQYATMVEQTVTFWTATVEALEAAATSDADSAPPAPSPSSPLPAAQEDWQAYEDLISPLRDEYHQLFPLSTESQAQPADQTNEDYALESDLESDEGYIIVPRSVPIQPDTDRRSVIARRKKTLKRLLLGKGSSRHRDEVGVRGLMMWDCQKGLKMRLRGGGAGGAQSGIARPKPPPRFFSLKRVLTRMEGDDV